MSPEEQLQEMIQLGVPKSVLIGFCRANGLPEPELTAVQIVMRPVVAVSAPRPRRRSSRKTRKKITPTAATSTARVETRFDLTEIYEND